MNWLDEFLDTHLEELVALRRQLHMNPELSGEEHETTALLAQRLEVAGLEPRVLASGTGLLCDLPSSSTGRPIVALRADIDALAMDDEKDVTYRSQVEGVAHACGHDVHTAIVLGAGLALARHLEGRTVRLVFQPAEESLPGGARDVIANDGLRDVSYIFGLHCDPKLDTGRLGVRAGPITSAADLLAVRLHGPGGHTARPQLTADLVAIAGRLAAELPAAARDEGLNVVFGALHAGHASNVIPTLAELRGTVRAPERDHWDAAPAVIARLLDELVLPSGATYEVRHTRGIPPVINNELATELIAEAGRAALGTDAVVPTEQSAGGDDFAWYLDQVPGSYARLGVHDPASKAPALDLHAGTFDVDERAIALGVRVLVSTALLALDAHD